MDKFITRGGFFILLRQKVSQKVITIGFLLIVFFSLSITAKADEGDSRDPVLNNLNLTPASSVSPELNAYLDELLPTIVTEEMSNYQKLQACYDYVINNTTYGSHLKYMGNVVNGVTCRQIQQVGGEVEGYAAATLSSGKGLCNGYAAAWMVLAEKLGVETNLARGYTRRAGGGYTYHEWAEVTIDGVVYTVDPQLEQSLRKSKSDKYSAFFVTYAQVGNRYKRNA